MVKRTLFFCLTVQLLTNVSCLSYRRESNGPRECDATKLRLAAAFMKNNFPAVGDTYVMYPQRWAPFMLHFGALLMGRSIGQWLLAHSSKGFHGQKNSCVLSPNPATFLARDLHVLETIACHNNRHCLYHPHYYLYGERLCGEMLRAGESAVEGCLKGSTAGESGISSCNKNFLRRWRASSPDLQADELRWFALHYHPYTSMELYPCMSESKNGWRCAPGTGGYPSLDDLLKKNYAPSHSVTDNKLIVTQT